MKKYMLTFFGGNMALRYNNPLESEGKRIDAGGIQDYHFPDTTEGGFIILNANSLDQTPEIAVSSPIIKNGGYILVRPCGEIK